MLLALNPVFEHNDSNDGTNANNIISQHFKYCKHFFALLKYFLYFDNYAPKIYVSKSFDHSKMLKSSLKSFVLTIVKLSVSAANCEKRALIRSSALRLTVLPAARTVFI